MELGKRIKEIRLSHNMKLKDLAAKSGIQIATLSRIENLKMIGTLGCHVEIARALGMELTELYKGIALPTSPPAQTAPEPAETFQYNQKASYEILTGNILQKKMLPIILRIETGGKTSPEQGRAGSEKFLFVLNGEILVYIAGKTHALKKNNTLYFNAAMKHYYENPGPAEARIISVATPVEI